MNESGYPFDNINQHFRCFAHILNLSVQDMLKLLNIDFVEDSAVICFDDKLSYTDDEYYELDEDENDEFLSEISPSIAIKN